MVEVLLAIGIFGLVVIAIYSSWSSILRGTRIGLTAAAEVQRTRVAIRSLEESLGAAVMYADNPLYYGFYADTTGDYAYLSFVARLPESFPGSGLFPGQTVRRVTFHVDADKNLLLSQSTLLDISDKPYTIKLAPKTAVFQLEFFNPRMNEWIPEWIATNALPTLVRVAMDFGDKKGQESITIRSIPLTAQAITRFGGGPRAQQLGAGGGGMGQPNRPNIDPRRREGRGGQPAGDGGFPESPYSWRPPGSLPPGFNDNRGSLNSRNTSIFPPMPGR